MSGNQNNGFIYILQEFSIPLLSGVAVAMLAANLAPEWYEHTIHGKPLGDPIPFPLVHGLEYPDHLGEGEACHAERQLTRAGPLEQRAGGPALIRHVHRQQSDQDVGVHQPDGHSSSRNAARFAVSRANAARAASRSWGPSSGRANIPHRRSRIARADRIVTASPSIS